MSSLLGCMLNSRIAAIAPVSGLRWPAPCAGRPIPVLTFHGLADPQNPYARKGTGRGAEWVESVPDALAGWARHNGCRPESSWTIPPAPLSTMRYAGCREGAEVRMIRIDGLGHTWTKEEVDTTAVMWQFFKSHRLARDRQSDVGYRGSPGNLNPKRRTRSGMLLGSTARPYRSARAARTCGSTHVDPPSLTNWRSAPTSKPAGEMISSSRAGSSPAFQNVCHWFRELDDQIPWSADHHVFAKQRPHASLNDVAVPGPRASADGAVRQAHARTSDAQPTRSRRRTRDPQS